MSLLTPEQLAEIRQDVSPDKAPFGYKPVKALLDHIEAREQQVKAALDKTYKTVRFVTTHDDVIAVRDRTRAELHDAATSLGITLG